MLAVLALVCSACSSDGGEAVPGVTATTITLGGHLPLTGIQGINGSSVGSAAKAYFDYVNNNGGVNGRKIIYTYRDDAYSATNALAHVRHFVEREKVFAIFDGFGTPAHQGVVGYLNSRHVPDIFPVSGCPCLNNPKELPYTFAWLTNYYREGKILGTYVKKTFPGKRIAYFYQDDGVGRSGVAGLDEVIPATQVVARKAFKANQAQSVTPAAEALFRARPDVVVSFSAVAFTLLLRSAQEKAGSEAQLVVSQTGSDPATVAGLLKQDGRSKPVAESSRLLQGIITDAPLVPLTDTSNSWVTLLRKIHNKYTPGEPLNRYSEIGMATAYTFVQALQRAGRNLTRQSLIAVLEQGNLASGPGLTPLDYSPTSHAGSTGVQIGTIQDGVVVLHGRPMVTDDGEGPVEPSPESPPPAPENGIPAP
ncbi:ABC transporter substrate-binding protein [Streptomyces sp. NPDC005529]|uniref:ABC transporter substrate-binding protein n=1 Tax=unclassified Streptomyces TaxID=2593676 RepID=UPI0033B83E1C